MKSFETQIYCLSDPKTTEYLKENPKLIDLTRNNKNKLKQQ